MPPYYISLPNADITEDFDLFIICETVDSYEMLKISLDKYSNQAQKRERDRVLNLNFEIDIDGNHVPYPHREYKVSDQDKAIIHYEIYHRLPRGSVTIEDVHRSDEGAAYWF